MANFFCPKHADGPNSGLCFDGLGLIGLPFSSLRSIATSDDKVGHSWNVNAEQVCFENPAWPAFMDNMLHKVCDALGANEETHRPRCELIRMRLSSIGSSPPISVDMKKHRLQITTLVINLPSKFAGGAIHGVKHGDNIETYDCTPAMVTETTVVAWHRDATHEVLQVNDGYQLALHYGVFSTAEQPVLTLAALEDGVHARLGEESCQSRGILKHVDIGLLQVREQADMWTTL